MRKILVLPLLIVLSNFLYTVPAYSAVKESDPKIVKMKQIESQLSVEEKQAYKQFLNQLALKQFYAGLEIIAVTACDGDLPPCYIVTRESKGNIYAVNPGHLGAPYGDPGDPTTHASGKWQFMPGTWNKYKGYAYAAAAPALIQNDKAREVWNGGLGASNWACC